MNILTLPPQDGPQVVARILATRWKTILASALCVPLLVAGWLAIAGPHYTARTAVELAIVGVEPASSSRSANSAIDMATEIALVRSGETGSRASQLLGGEVSAEEIASKVGIETNSGAVVIMVTWTAKDPETARRISGAIAQAYLAVRGDLVLERASAIAQSLDEEIALREVQLAAVVSGTAEGAASRESLLASISSLNSRRAALVGLDAPTGRIITPDSTVDVVKGPSKKKYLLVALGAGVFVGLALALIRERTDQRIHNPRHLAHVVAAPVWSPDEADYGQLRWFGAARMATLIAKEKGVLALLIASSEPEAPLLVSALSAAQSDLHPDVHLRVLDLDGSRADLLRELADVQQVAIAPSARSRKNDVVQLVDQVDLSGCELTGAFFIPRSSAKELTLAADTSTEEV
ncbi:hypothetical protein [Schaalia suimastitidis]|uniref:hypothetical protein n=1 Tax=Schaalia suimastitidis TaxID=121163 RepID=UPI00041ADF4E|nr:hypothetical protein [Schaalia suimastitidis]